MNLSSPRAPYWTRFLVAWTLAASGAALPTLFAQGTQAVVELWRAIDTDFIGVAMDLGPFDDVVEVGHTTILGDPIVTKKFDRDGRLLWERLYDPAERLRATWIAADRFDNVFVSGFSFTGSSPTPSGMLTLKYNAQGTLLWANRIAGPFAQAVRVETDANGNAYVAGRLWLSSPSGFVSHDFALVKYAPDGRRLWLRTFDNAGAVDDPTSLAISRDGRFVAVAGRSAQSALIVVYGAAGNLAWSFTRSDIGTAWDVAFGPSGELVAGASTWTPQTSNRMVLLKFNPGGQPAFIRSYPGNFVQRLAVDSRGNIAATGVDSLGGTSYLNWRTFKTDPAGNQLWSRLRDAHGSNDEYPNSIAIDPFDAVYVTGQSGPGPSTGNTSLTRMATVKYASNGTLRWAATVPEIGRGLSVRIGSDNTVFVFGDFMFTARYRETGLPDLPPSAPSGLTAQPSFNGSSHGMNLTWRDNASNEFRVEVERCTGINCANFAKIGQTTGENAVTFRDTALAPGTTYSYRIRAVGSAGASAYSNRAQGTTVVFSSPAAPTQLTATRTGDWITLRWRDNSTNELQFTIERCEGSGCSAFMQVNAVDGNLTEYVDYDARPGTTYSYRVRAWSTGGYSGYSNVATASTAGP
jgi:hypothetical protein